MIRMMLIFVALLPGAASASGLACNFTQLCSPLTDCQSHPGLPFTFDIISGALALTTADGILFGTPLPHIEAPALALLFEAQSGSTLLLSISTSGEAAMTQHDISPAGQVTSVSYFGTCEPTS